MARGMFHNEINNINTNYQQYQQIINNINKCVIINQQYQQTL